MAAAAPHAALADWDPLRFADDRDLPAVDRRLHASPNRTCDVAADVDGEGLCDGRIAVASTADGVGWTCATRRMVAGWRAACGDRDRRHVRRTRVSRRTDCEPAGCAHPHWNGN